MDDLTQEFLAESLEGLDRMERCLTELERRPADAELLGEIFRSVHTIKGATGFLGFARLEELAHAGEHLLGLLRDGLVRADERVISGLLQLMDGLRAMLQCIAATGVEGEVHARLIALVRELGGGTRVPAVTVASAPVVSVAEKTLRVDVEVLNRMMNLVGELVLTRNQLLQSHLETGPFAELARRLDTVTADLRVTVMEARMQPVGHLFGKLPRLIRDLAKECGKRVRVEFEGQGTGLDKSLLEAIKDPLTHAVRNAVDHGIESPAARVAAGKGAEGVVSLRASHQGGWVVVEVADDGAGISLERVTSKALERGIVTAGMSAHDVMQMIFLPGFSTAAAVTTVSGRGVGLDVVRANVDRAGGTVEVRSEVGQGTVLRLRVPLTLAIVPALVVGCGGDRFCLPQGALVEMVYVEAGTRFDRMGNAEFLRLRDRLLPLVRLDRMLGICGGDAGQYVVVVETERARFGLVVDDLLTPEEIVVKPLSEVLRGVGLFSGATVLGNGMLALIVDVAAVAARAGVTAADCVAELAEEREEVVPQFLVYRVGTERRTMPLERVERIETVPARDVERMQGRLVLQYRGRLLLLEDEGNALERADAVTVLMCGDQVGVVVAEVLDVADGSWVSDDMAMVAGRVTMVHRGRPHVQQMRSAA